MSYWGISPAGKRFYVEAKHRVPLAFAVFVFRDRMAFGDPAGHDVAKMRWERVALIERRPYKNEHARVNGSYVPFEGEMAPETKVQETALWWREVGRYAVEHVAIVPLSESTRYRGRVVR